jgi:DNA-binding GntR family transcriptional regulator
MYVIRSVTSAPSMSEGTGSVMPPRQKEATATAEPGRVQLAARAADTLREMISHGTLLPGEKIHQVDVAQKVGVSRSPLREALRTLEGEGLVKYETNRGYVVSRLRMNELAEIYRMRALLEAEMVTHIKTADPDSLDALQQCVSTMTASAQEGDFEQLVVSHRKFQNIFLALSGLKLFLIEFQRLSNMVDSYNAPHRLSPAMAKQVIRTHRAIVRALRAGDLEKMREVVAEMPQFTVHVVVGLPNWE